MDRMPRTPRLIAIAAAAVLLAGCASATAPAQESAVPEASHTMPDGSVMSGAEHEAHGAGSGDSAEASTDHSAHSSAADGSGPSPAAEMICGGQVETALASLLRLEGAPEPSSAWDAPMYTCTYDVDGAPLVLSVHDTADPAVGEQHFAALQHELAADEIEGMLGLGLPSFSTGDGVVAFLRDGKTLLVDATALPEGLADGAMTRDGAAYAAASAVLVCWVEHD